MNWALSQGITECVMGMLRAHSVIGVINIVLYGYKRNMSLKHGRPWTNADPGSLFSAFLVLGFLLHTSQMFPLSIFS